MSIVQTYRCKMLTTKIYLLFIFKNSFQNFLILIKTNPLNSCFFILLLAYFFLFFISSEKFTHYHYNLNILIILFSVLAFFSWGNYKSLCIFLTIILDNFFNYQEILILTTPICEKEILILTTPIFEYYKELLILSTPIFEYYKELLICITIPLGDLRIFILDFTIIPLNFEDFIFYLSKDDERNLVIGLGLFGYVSVCYMIFLEYRNKHRLLQEEFQIEKEALDEAREEYLKTLELQQKENENSPNNE
jgi:hypothetical protein